ncbi:DUF2399 domain-containing protein [Streptomyces sp. NPDC005091]
MVPSSSRTAQPRRPPRRLACARPVSPRPAPCPLTDVHWPAPPIGHVRAALRTVPRARPWRLSADDYVRSLHPTPFQPTPLDTERLPETGWDPALHTAMYATGRPAYEEALLDDLLDDIRSGHPHPNPKARTGRIQAARSRAAD